MDATNAGEFERRLRREAKQARFVKQRHGVAGAVYRTQLRIIGGDMSSRKIDFTTNSATRPMKDRTREAIFSHLGRRIEGAVVIDLFGGSGILSFEAVSRGAGGAIIVEREVERVAEIDSNINRLQLNEQLVCVAGDAFRVSHSPEKFVANYFDSAGPWLIFVCPPYEMWKGSGNLLSRMIERWIEQMPVGSAIVVEMTEQMALADVFTPEILADRKVFDRVYRPARIAILWKTV